MRTTAPSDQRNLRPGRRPGDSIAELADRWAREAAAREQGAAAVRDLTDAECKRALERLHRESDDDQLAWRRS
jgi:hypothetical protein